MADKLKGHYELKESLTNIALQYNSLVDEGRKTNQSTDDLFYAKTGYSLYSKIQETIDDSEYGSQLPDKMKANKSTYTLFEYQIKAYERFKSDVSDRSTQNWEKANTSGPMSDETVSELTSKNVGFAMYKTEIIASSLNDLSKKNEHIKNVSKLSDLKFGDVVQIYQPYEDNHPKNNTKNNIDRYGQNRFYGIMQRLPNGDFLAVDFRGHRNHSEDSVALDFNPKYAYPSSKFVKPSLDLGDKLLVQLPKEAIATGSALREKYEAASYGKPYNGLGPASIRVFEMSPANLTKLSNFKNKINQAGLDIGWSKTNQSIVAASGKGDRMFNPLFSQQVNYQLKIGTYDKRNMLMTQRINRQTLIRNARYGDESTAKIQTNAQKAYRNKENASHHVHKQLQPDSQEIQR